MIDIVIGVKASYLKWYFNSLTIGDVPLPLTLHERI
jgi:hypothetical protein